MDSFEALSQAMAEVVRQGRLGTLVSLRFLDHTTADHGLIEPNLARGLHSVCDWLGSAPELVSASGGVQAGQITVLIRFGSGSTALVSAGIYGSGSPKMNAILVGNRGVSSWESVDPDELDTPADNAKRQASTQEPPPRIQEILKAVRAALATGRSVSLADATRAAVPLVVNPPGSPAASPRNKPVPIEGSPKLRGPTAKPPFGTLLIAGGATHQEDYARALAADSRCRLVALVDEPEISPRRKRWNEQLAGELSIPVLPDIDAALAREDVSIVSVCAEPERRARLIRRCAEAGKHLYLDKPLAASREEAQEVAASIAQAGVVNQMFSMVHTPMAQRARRLVRSNRLGDVVGIHVDLFFAKGRTGTARFGRPRVESKRPTRFETIDSKRELYNIGVYPLIFISWLLGRPVRRVSASTANYFFQEHQANDMEDFGLLLLELEGGITASVMVGRTGWRSHPLGGVNQAVIVGTRGTATVNAYRPRVEVWNDDPPWLPPRPDQEDPMGFWRSTPIRLGMATKQGWILPGIVAPSVDDARAFLDCVEQGIATEVDAALGASAVEVLMASYESAATGQTVSIASRTS